MMKTVRVSAAVIEHDGRYFATQRGYGEMKDGWEFPGGKIEEGETPEEALIREIREELDTEIAVDRFLMKVEHDYPSFHLSMDCFLCHIIEGVPHLLEHEAAKWVSKEELDQIGWLPADRILVDRILKAL